MSGTEADGPSIVDGDDAPPPIYQPLDESRRQFRILRLDGGTGDDMVSGTLITASLPSLPITFDEGILFEELSRIQDWIRATVLEQPHHSTATAVISRGQKLDEELGRAQSIYDSLECLFQRRFSLLLSMFEDAEVEQVKALFGLMDVKHCFQALRAYSSLIIDILEKPLQGLPGPPADLSVRHLLEQLERSNVRSFMRSLQRVENLKNLMFLPFDVGDEFGALPELDDQSIQGIQHAKASDPPRYDAVSYAWGDLAATDEIYLNGVITQAPASAVNALRHLRYPYQARQLWIDAVCINQKDIAERESQVLLMRDIYSGAIETLIWLGEADDQSEAAFAELRLLAQVPGRDREEVYGELLQQGTSHRLDRVRATMADSTGTEVTETSVPTVELISTVFALRWFRRLWVYQEVLLSRKCLCMSGQLTIEWEVLEDAVHVLTYHERIPVFRHGDLSWLGIRLPWLTARGKKEPKSLYSLVGSNWQMECSDQRDTIYGFLGLTSWTRCQQSIPLRAQPNYRGDVMACMKDATIAMIEETQSLGPLLHGWSGNQTPTWAVRWHLRGDRFQRLPRWFELPHDHWRPRPLNACGSAIVEVNSLARDGWPQSLFPMGYVAGSINSRSDALTLEQYEKDPSQRQQFTPLVRSAMGFATNAGHDPSTRAILTLLMASDDPGDESYHSILNWYTNMSSSSDRSAQHEEDLDNRPPPNSLLTRSEVSNLEMRLYCTCNESRLFTTDTGLIGIGDKALQAGDRLVILFGCWLPIVLRPQGSYATWIGPAFVAGIMNGEFVEKMEAEGTPPEVFEVR